MIASAPERRAAPREPAWHVAALDGLRGLAALVVVIRHTVNAIPMPRAWRDQLYESPLAILLTSQGAVQLFFVLSGWVLAASLARGPAGPRAWIPFWVRRVCRIHLPFVCAAAVAFVASRWWHAPDPDAVTRWLLRSMVRPSFGEFLASLAFPGSAARLLPIGWTLTIEMIYSFALPLLVWVARPARGGALLAIALLGLLTPWRTVWYGLDFALGVVLFQERDAITGAIRRLPLAARAVLPAAGAALLSAPLWHRVVEPGALIGFGRGEIVGMGIGAALLVASALAMPALARALGCRPFAALGRISYSVYLLHRPLLTLVAPFVLTPTLLASQLVVVKGVTTASAVLLLAIVVVGSIAIAIPFHRAVEIPAMRLGQTLARRAATRLGVERLEKAT